MEVHLSLEGGTKHLQTEKGSADKGRGRRGVILMEQCLEGFVEHCQHLQDKGMTYTHIYIYEYTENSGSIPEGTTYSNDVVKANYTYTCYFIIILATVAMVMTLQTVLL